MQRVMVIGSPGAGKSTFSRKLQKKTNLPIIYLDRLFWKVDKTTVSPNELVTKIKHELTTKNSWVMDGNYSKYLFDERLSKSDTVFFLDYDVDTCLEDVRQRRGMKRPDLPWIEEKEDPEFMDYIREFPVKQKPKILKLLSKHPDIKLYHFKSREEANNYLNNL